MGLIGLDALGQAAGVALARRPGDHVGQEHGEWFVADDLARAPDGVAEAERDLLPGEAGRARHGTLARQQRGGGRLAAALQRVLQLVSDIEVILDHPFAAPGDEDEVLDPRLARLVDDVLQHRRVHDGEHFLGDRLRRRQEARPEPGYREDGLANFLRHRTARFPVRTLSRGSAIAD